MSSIEERIRSVRNRVEAACLRSGRDPGAITMVAVSKTMPVEAVQQAFQAGMKDFGENRVQEARDKITQFGPGPDWHLIGSLQRNKVRMAIPLFSLIHSIDSVRLMEVVSQEAARMDQVVRILLEVNVSGEPSKHGFTPEQVAGALHAAQQMPSLQVEGLMTMAPYEAEPESTRLVFRGLRALFGELGRTAPVGNHWQTLSMGMTNDFEVAVEEGATMIRIGRAVFSGD